MTDSNFHAVHIEFLRIQTFLFAVPRLRDMIGANVLLGETIRDKLPNLAEENDAYQCDVAPFSLPSVDKRDPLYDENRLPEDWDDPKRLYQKGILSRDGGHFRALFPNEEDAENFKQAAASLLIRELPGLKFEISVQAIFDKTKQQNVKAQTQAIFDLPQLQVCQESGNGPAVKQYTIKPKTKPVWISETVDKTKQSGGLFLKTLKNKGQQTRDIIGLLSHKLPFVGKKEATDLDHLSGNEYLAVIHADGNGVGARFKAGQKTQVNDNQDNLHHYLSKEAYDERFFHSMRVAVRRAVVEALNQTFGKLKDIEYQPYQLLMLGGDDLLLVCQAKYAFDFLIHYAKALTQIPLIDNKKPLSIGAGVVITSPRIPFHHLHHLAEELASSAKHLFRRRVEENISVVDWSMSTNAWTDKAIISRQRNMRIAYEVDGVLETLALTGRPYPILQSAEQASLNSLESLSQAAKSLTEATKENQAARSQLRQLVYELAQGRRWADLCLQGLPKDTLDVLSTIASLREGSCWQAIDTQTWQTVLADLIELYEIPNLKRQDKNEQADTV